MDWAFMSNALSRRSHILAWKARSCALMDLLSKGPSGQERQTERQTECEGGEGFFVDHSIDLFLYANV